MKNLTLVAALLPLVSAHTRFTTLFVNSKSQGDGTCIRMDMDPLTTTDWIPGLTSPEMACGVGGDVAVNRTCPLKAGDSISLLHRLWTDASQPGSIDPSHKGSTAIYMKKLADASSNDPYSTQAAGDGWFKIAWNGYDESSKQWGTEVMITNDGKVSATVPSDLSSGYYLIRSEVLALQNIVDDRVQPQFYAGCAQVYIAEGSGNASPETVSIPGYISDDTAALSYDIYSNSPPAVPYQEFGPAVYGSSSTATSKASAAKRWNWGGDNSDRGSGRYAAYAAQPTTTSRSRWSNNRRPGSNQAGDEVASLTSSTNLPINTKVNVLDTDVDNDANSATNAAADTTTSPSQSTKPTTLTSTSTSTPKSQSQSQSTNSSSSASVPIGSCPQSTILEIANQCITALDPWTSDTPGSLPKCWAASQTCWDKLDVCWNNLSPAINANDMNSGCHLWEGVCNRLVEWCEGGNLEGPPGYGVGNGNGVAERKVKRRSFRA